MLGFMVATGLLTISVTELIIMATMTKFGKHFLELSGGDQFGLCLIMALFIPINMLVLGGAFKFISWLFGVTCV